MLKRLPTRPRLSSQGIMRIAIVASRYNSEFVDPMVARAREEIELIEPTAKIEIVHAPGAFEIPFLARQVIERRKPDAVICLGVILRGETGHADIIAFAVSDILCRLSVETLIPVTNGVLLLNNEEQAIERCLGVEFNRGSEGARTAIETLRASRSLTKR